MKKILAVTALMLATMVLGCADKTKNQEPTTILRIHGSNTIGAHLMPELVIRWLRQAGAMDALIDTGGVALERRVLATLGGQRVAVEIHSYGSGTGFDDLAWGKCDIAMSSKPIDAEKAGKLANLGNMSSPEAEHVIALDGIAILVHPQNQLPPVSLEQLQRIFSGEIKRWEEISPDIRGEIHIERRDDVSGTHDVFKHQVLRGSSMSGQAHINFSSDELAKRIGEDPLAIGYSSVSFRSSNRTVPILTEGGAKEPSILLVQTEDYPLSRRLFLYTAEQPKNAQVVSLVKYLQSVEGQAQVEELGFVAQILRLHAVEPPLGAPEEYSKLASSAKRVSANIRFRDGTLRLDNRSLKDLSRLRNLVQSPSLRSCRIHLAGFSDASGDPAANQSLSQERAEMVASLLEAQLGEATFTIHAFGSVLPVASNQNEEGRARNRRVEVWLHCPGE